MLIFLNYRIFKFLKLIRLRMSLALLVSNEGKEWTNKIRVRGKEVAFVRGYYESGKQTMDMIVEVNDFSGSTRHRIGLSWEYISTFTEPIEIAAQVYDDGIIFRSRKEEDSFFNMLKVYIHYGLIDANGLQGIKQNLDSRLSYAYSQLSDGGRFNSSQIFAFNLLAASIAGIAGAVAHYTSNKSKSKTLPFIYAAAGFIAADKVQKYLEKREVIRKVRITDMSEFFREFQRKHSYLAPDGKEIY